MLFFYENNANESGIYEIRNRISNKSYIGQAKSFKKRWKHHRWILKSNKHRSEHLQRSFNKYFNQLESSNFLEFHILEIMKNSTMEERKNREEFWLNKAIEEYGIERIYNNRLKPTKESQVWSHNPKETIKIFKKIRKNKTYNEIYGEEKAKKVKQNQSKSISNFYQTEEGKQIVKKHFERLKNKTYEDIYGPEQAKNLKIKIGLFRKNKNYEELYGKEKSNEMKKSHSKAMKGLFAKTFDLSENPLVSPDGIKYYNIINLTEFCKNHNLGRSYIRDIINKKRYSYNNWKLLNPPLQKSSNKKYYKVNLLSPNGEIFNEIFGLADFAEKYNLHASALLRVINGKVESHKGWKLINAKFIKRSNIKFFDLSDQPLMSPTGEIFIKIEGLDNFCKKYNLRSASLSRILNKTRKSYNGWKLVDKI